MIPIAQKQTRNFGAACIAAAAVFLLAGFLPGRLATPSAAQAGKKLPPPPADLPSHINYLARQLYGVPLDESEPITGQIETLVLDHMGQWIAAHPPGAVAGSSAGLGYDVQVRREIERIFGELQNPFFANGATFARPFGQGEFIGVGYTLSWSDYDRANVVALFVTGGEKAEAPAHPVAVTHFVPDTDLHYQFFNPAGVPSGAEADRVWFLVYGTRLGKSHPRLSAILYRFDGKTLDPLWQTLDVYDGRISFGGDRIQINYLKEDEFTQAVAAHTSVIRHEAAYRVTEKGVELEYDH